MPWLHGLKTRHEQHKESNYLKNKPFSKNSNYFWNVRKELLQKNYTNSTLPEAFLKNTVSELCLKGMQHF